MYQQIIKNIEELSRNNEEKILYLNTPVQIKFTPHTPPINIWALRTSSEMIYTMDGYQNWYQVDEDKDAALINSIFQRVSLLVLQQLKTA